MNKEGYIFGINGPVLKVKGCRDFFMAELVEAGDEHLVGEVIGITPEYTIVQVYENTTGLRTGEKVIGTGELMSITLGPSVLGNIFDGIMRPLEKIEELSGSFIKRGLRPNSLDTEKKWATKINVKLGQKVSGGHVLAELLETNCILHKVMLPPDVSGTVTFVAENGDYTINDCIVKVDDKEFTLCQKWPIRLARPIAKRNETNIPLVTGQRIIDTLFPVALGGTAAIPGGFGTGKTMTQHQLAKWSAADIIVYVGCGERGNEMTQVLEEFRDLIDPKTGNKLIDRTVLIANTSNMPVAAREASIYTGITIAEFYRDMGYNVAIMADSTSRWAEALREISGRLEEMPAEEGFPSYLASRLSLFYERAGYVTNLNETEGSVTIIGAVSPAGGDFSEPVTQNTKRFVRTFWALDRSLAYARHYPAIDWNSSYSEYFDDLDRWFKSNVGADFTENRLNIQKILAEENRLNEIVKLIGSDVLPDDQRLTLEIAKVIRVGFLQQNAFHAEDTYVPLSKQNKMMETILYLHQKSKQLISEAMPITVLKRSDIFEKVIAMKYDIPNNDEGKFDEYKKMIDDYYDEIIRTNG